MTVKINRNPAIPLVKNFNSAQLKDWIVSNCEQEFQPALCEAVDNIRRISFTEFVKELGKCIEPNILKNASVLVSERKSNKWVAEVALAYFPSHFSYNTKFESLGSEDANDFVDNLDKIPTQNWPTKLVLFDDGSFSGKQMTRHISAIIQKLEVNKAQDTSIDVIIPFVTSIAKKMLTDIKCPQNVALNIHNTGNIKTVEESISKDSFICLNKLYDNYLSSGVALSYFDHKIPNTQSFLFAHLGREALPHIKPPYVNPNKSPSKSRQVIQGRALAAG